jgi:hypothetical protein
MIPIGHIDKSATLAILATPSHLQYGQVCILVHICKPFTLSRFVSKSQLQHDDHGRHHGDRHHDVHCIMIDDVSILNNAIMVYSWVIVCIVSMVYICSIVGIACIICMKSLCSLSPWCAFGIMLCIGKIICICIIICIRIVIGIDSMMCIAIIIDVYHMIGMAIMMGITIRIDM